jgi:hypothetical protein
MIAVKGNGEPMVGGVAVAKSTSRASTAVAGTNGLLEAVQALAAERTQLVERVGRIERQLDDLTGAIKTTAGAVAALPPAHSAATPTALSARVAAAQPEAPASMVDGLRVEYGVDLGGGATIEALRSLWSSARVGNDSLFEGLYPVAALRENGRTRGTELRLVVGPLTDADAGMQLCEAVAAAGHYCSPAPFEGQRLAEAEKAPERRPAAVAKPAPKAAVPQRRFWWWFQ